MKQILLLILTIAYSNVFAQDFEPPETRFGKGIKENFENQYAEISEGKDAIYLLDLMDNDYTMDGESFAFEEKYHVRIKVLSKAAIEKADVELVFLHEDRKQNITNIKAASYNYVNGKVAEEKLSKKDIFEEKINDRLTRITFAIPDVKEGSILEYEFTTITRGRRRPATWYFSNEYPVVYSQVSFNCPEWYRFSYYTTGFTDYAFKDAKSSTVDLGLRYKETNSTLSTWGKTNIPEVIDEDYTANIDDFRDQMQFRLNTVQFPGSTIETYNTTWMNLNNNLLEVDYKDQQKDKKYIEETVAEIIAGKTKEEDKIKALYNYVVDNIDIERDGWVYTSNPVKKVLKDKSGNIADANLLLVNMLQSANIEAYPMLVSTRTDGYIDQMYANMSAFTYPVAYVKTAKKDLIINATSSYRPYYLARLIDYNMSGWVVSDSNPGWVELESLSPKSVRQYQIDAKLTAEGNYSGTTTISSSNYLSVEDRYSIDEDDTETRFKELYNGEEEAEFTNTEKGDTDDDYSTFKYSADFSIDNHAQVLNDYLYFNPLIFDLVKENPFTQEERKYPVDFPFPENIIHNITIELPEGYQLEEAVEPIIVKMGKKAVIKMVVSQPEDGVLSVFLQQQRNETVFQPNEYKYLQELYDLLVEQMNNQITLKKISE